MDGELAVVHVDARVAVLACALNAIWGVAEVVEKFGELGVVKFDFVDQRVRCEEAAVVGGHADRVVAVVDDAAQHVEAVPIVVGGGGECAALPMLLVDGVADRFAQGERPVAGVVGVEHAAVLGEAEEEDAVEQGLRGLGDELALGLGLFGPEDGCDAPVDAAEDHVAEVVGDLLVAAAPLAEQPVEERFALAGRNDPGVPPQQQPGDAETVSVFVGENLAEQIFTDQQSFEVDLPAAVARSRPIGVDAPAGAVGEDRPAERFAGVRAGAEQVALGLLGRGFALPPAAVAGIEVAPPRLALHDAGGAEHLLPFRERERGVAGVVVKVQNVVDHIVGREVPLTLGLGPTQCAEQRPNRVILGRLFVRIEDGLHGAEHIAGVLDELVEFSGLVEDRLVLGQRADLLVEEGVGPDGRQFRHTARVAGGVPQNTAIGFTGEPVPPCTLSGSTQSSIS